MHDFEMSKYSGKDFLLPEIAFVSPKAQKEKLTCEVFQVGEGHVLGMRGRLIWLGLSFGPLQVERE